MHDGWIRGGWEATVGTLHSIYVVVGVHDFSSSLRARTGVRTADIFVCCVYSTLLSGIVILFDNFFARFFFPHHFDFCYKGLVKLSAIWSAVY